jgi:hypothetical protein
MNNVFELTFVYPNGDWTWEYHSADDYHHAITIALMVCPREARIKGIELVPEYKVAANCRVSRKPVYKTTVEPAVRPSVCP